MKKIPPNQDGYIQTLNKMGQMTTTLDPYSSDFISFAKNTTLPVLEIGAAYGVATLPTLKTGARVIANDLSQDHLDILKSQVDLESQSRLTLLPGSFPDEINLEPNSIEGALVCRVLHFFSGPMIEASLEKIFRWLVPGGKLYVVAETPYMKSWESYLPTYERLKKSGHPWPGFIDRVESVAPSRAHVLPPSVHWLDPDILSRLFKNAGFVIERTEFINRTDFPDFLRFDGRESVGIIGIKP